MKQKSITLTKINLQSGSKEQNIESLIEEEHTMYDASKAFLNNGGEILKEIEAK